MFEVLGLVWAIGIVVGGYLGWGFTITIPIAAFIGVALYFLMRQNVVIALIQERRIEGRSSLSIWLTYLVMQALMASILFGIGRVISTIIS